MPYSYSQKLSVFFKIIKSHNCKDQKGPLEIIGSNHPVQTGLSRAICTKPYIHRLILLFFKEGDFIISLGRVKKGFLLFILYLLCFCLFPLSLVLSLGTLQRAWFFPLSILSVRSFFGVVPVCAAHTFLHLFLIWGKKTTQDTRITAPL